MKSSHERFIGHVLGMILRSQQTGLTQPLRIRMAIAKVEAVKIVRGSVMGIFLLSLFYLFLFTGFVLFHVGLFFYLDWTVVDKGALFMIIGAVYFLLMILGMMMGLSQRRWMRKSGADKAVYNALRK
ncbi:phage holin family protein [Kiritimatiellaeota bacterium B1221]|nr:phage holin family protein [Kiritimatiellaeota bacterium B1221]